MGRERRLGDGAAGALAARCAPGWPAAARSALGAGGADTVRGWEPTWCGGSRYGAGVGADTPPNSVLNGANRGLRGASWPSKYVQRAYVAKVESGHAGLVGCAP